ncbi:MAG: T9SS type A sorting domain-containing protein [Ignavibacteria bacterium]
MKKTTLQSSFKVTHETRILAIAMAVTLIASLFCFTHIVVAQSPQWSTLPNSPSSGVRFDDVDFTDLNTGYIINGAAGQLFKTTNAGNNWDTLFKINGSSLRSLGFFDANTGIIGTINDDTSKLMFRTTNAGLNWNYVNNFEGKRPLGICGISIVTNNIGYACGRYSSPARVVRTTNAGESWSIVFSDTSLATNLIDCYFWSPDSGIVVGGYGTAWTTTYSVILLTANGGQTWQRVYKSSRINEYCWKISFVSRSTGYVSIERSSFILKTTNTGLNWTDMFAVSGYYQQGIGFHNENTGWLGGSGTSYETTNGGNSWHATLWGQGLNKIIFLNDTIGYAAGRRIYKYSNDPVGINHIGSEIPQRFELKQNYPNPFNPVTKIEFSIPATSEYSNLHLRIFNSLGGEIATLINETLSPGTYEVEFDGGNLASGLYYYKLELGAFSETKKMVLLR